MPPDTSTDIKIMAKPLAGEAPTVLMGFPGSGLVGSIALQYMVDQAEFPLIGTMTSKYFPPFAMMAKGLVNVPVRIYEKPPLVAIVADIPVHPMICYEVANGIMDWLDPPTPRRWSPSPAWSRTSRRSGSSAWPRPRRSSSGSRT